MFTLFMLMQKDYLFCLLKKLVLFLLCSLFSSKNSFNFFVGDSSGTCSIYSTSLGEKGFSDFRWDPTGGEGGQENTILKGTSKMYDPISKTIKISGKATLILKPSYIIHFMCY